jgi:hypothetical protein
VGAAGIKASPENGYNVGPLKIRLYVVAELAAGIHQAKKIKSIFSKIKKPCNKYKIILGQSSPSNERLSRYSPIRERVF